MPFTEEKDEVAEADNVIVKVVEREDFHVVQKTERSLRCGAECGAVVVATHFLPSFPMPAPSSSSAWMLFYCYCHACTLGQNRSFGRNQVNTFLLV